MGKFDTHGGYFAPKGYFRINEGGSHEENPNGGVQIGVDQNGTPNMLEEGEPVYNDYVYSDNIIADIEILQKHNLPTKYAGRLYSEIADLFVDEAEERPLDPISNNGLNAMLVRLADAQEEQKAAEQQAQMEEMLGQLSPEQLGELESLLAQEQQAEQDQAMQDQMAQEQIMQQQASPQDYMQQPESYPEDYAQPDMQAQIGAAQALQQMPPMMMACGGKLNLFDTGGGVGGGIRGTGRKPTKQEQYDANEILMMVPIAGIPAAIQNFKTDLRNGDFAYAALDAASMWPGMGLVGGAIKGGAKGLLKGGIKGMVKGAKVGKRAAKISKAGKAATKEASKSSKAWEYVFKPWRATKAAIETNRANKVKGFRRAANVAAGIGGDAGTAVIGIDLTDNLTGGALGSLWNGTIDAIKYHYGAPNLNDTLPKADRSQFGIYIPEDSDWAYGGPINRFKDGGKKDGDSKKSGSNNLISRRSYASGTHYDNPIEFGNLEGHPTFFWNNVGNNNLDRINNRFFIYPPEQTYDKYGYFPLVNNQRALRDNGYTLNWDATLGKLIGPGTPRYVNVGGEPYTQRDSTNEHIFPTEPGTTANMPPIKGAFSRTAFTTSPNTPVVQSSGSINTTLPTPKWLLNNPGQLKSEYELLNERLSNLVDTPKSDVDLSYLGRDVDRELNRNRRPNRFNLQNLRYWGPIANALQLGWNIFQKPDRLNVPYVSPVLPNGRMHLIDTTYNPLDENSAVVSLGSANARTHYNLANSGLGPSAGAAMVAADNNYASNYGNALAQIWDANNQRRNAVIGQRNQNRQTLGNFHLNINNTRAGILNQFALQNLQNDLMRQRYNHYAESQRWNNISQSLDALNRGISDIGVDAYNRNMANSIPGLDYDVDENGNVGYTLKKGNYKMNEDGSISFGCGGTLLKKYRR